ncbi:MAG: ATP-binding protein, partial [Prevotellaceae bacterium]|nr:ATP-binding protein [Prevotellaceae bacterium]
MARIKRKVENMLLRWKENAGSLPLMLIGARQTGKTFSINEFCDKHYQRKIEINFLQNEVFKSFFENSLNPTEIIDHIEVYFNTAVDPENTVVFFDEIQECEKAIASLKFFAESKTRYNVISAGSLSGVKINRLHTAFPVGKVQIEYMSPLDFEEFLWAVDEQILSDKIRQNFSTDRPFVQLIHEKAITLYKTFLFLGGMPAVVGNYLDSGKKITDFIARIKDNIITGYAADMAKYSENINSIKILKVYNSIKDHLAKENKKFRYRLIEENANKQKFETAIEWLIQAGLTLFCPLISNPVRPLKSDENNRSFKLYLSDVGLLAHLAGITQFDIFQNKNFSYIGALTENFVAQTFVSANKKLYYWTSGNEAEADFLLSHETGVIPCEVKAADNVKSKSLSVYVSKYKPEYSIRISTKNFGFENEIKSVPLYAAHCIN